MMASQTPFGDEYSSTSSIDFAARSTSASNLDEKRNPFDTPYENNSTAANSDIRLGQLRHDSSRDYFYTRRVKKGEVDKPWLTSKDPKEKWTSVIPFIGIAVGLVLAGLLVWDGLRSVVNSKYCSIYETDFSDGIDNDIWMKEAEVGGFGNGQFEQTTITDENVFARDGMLVIKPTLQDERLILTDNVIDLSADGTCSSDKWSNCLTSTNTTNGTIIQPVKSGRINLRKKAIRYGRVEVEAQLPDGDWLWPAIWMLPVTETYGAWPRSGEIDIVESRGNNHDYEQGGNNIISSALHWGPNSANDAWWRTNNKRASLHSTFSQKFHTFGLEWSEKYLFTYLDNRLDQVLYVNFDSSQSLWDRGAFPLSDKNGTTYVDPWSQTGHSSTPFDQDFYLIINLAVGGTNGWFQDGKSSKPWVNGSPSAKKDFWNAREKWLKTWENGNTELKIRAVRVWQQEGYNGCSNGIRL